MNKRVKLSDLIETGVIVPPFKIYASFKKHDFSAIIENDGFILMEGKRFTSLSLAAGHIRAKMSGPASDGFPYRRVNGWDFWRYEDERRGRRPISELRKVYEGGHDFDHFRT